MSADDLPVEMKLRALRVAHNCLMQKEGHLTAEDCLTNIMLELGELGIDDENAGRLILALGDVASTLAESAAQFARQIREGSSQVTGRDDEVRAGTVLVALLQQYNDEAR
jgi:hypothetical protein